jgi:hypothetical protein
LGFDGENLGNGVDMPLDDVATEKGGGGGGVFEVDRGLGAEVTKIRAGERFGDDVERKPARGERLGLREAATVYGDGVAERGLVTPVWGVDLEADPGGGLGKGCDGATSLDDAGKHAMRVPLPGLDLKPYPPDPGRKASI